MKKIIITESQYKKLVKHMYQPTNISCGPTCIKMVGDFFKGEIDTVDEICKYCGTDGIIGTPPERMKRGLDKLKIEYIEHINEENPFQSLRDVIDNGGLCIVRTFTHGVPHWIVIHSYDPENPSIFDINDPWLGPLTYDEDELDEIWKGRDYFFFEIVKENQNTDEEKIDEDTNENSVNIRLYNEKTDKSVIFDRLEEVYDKIGYPKETLWELLEPIDTNLSVVVEVNGKVGGFYFLREESIPLIGKKEDKILSELRGIEGVGLGVFKEYKNHGIGKKLIEYPKSLGFDYIWGFQLKGLENIENWLKRRKLYAESEKLYVTYEIFKK